MDLSMPMVVKKTKHVATMRANIPQGTRATYSGQTKKGIQLVRWGFFVVSFCHYENITLHVERLPFVNFVSVGMCTEVVCLGRGKGRGRGTLLNGRRDTFCASVSLMGGCQSVSTLPRYHGVSPYDLLMNLPRVCDCSNSHCVHLLLSVRRCPLFLTCLSVRLSERGVFLWPVVAISIHMYTNKSCREGELTCDRCLR